MCLPGLILSDNQDTQYIICFFFTVVGVLSVLFTLLVVVGVCIHECIAKLTETPKSALDVFKSSVIGDDTRKVSRLVY